MAPMAMPMAAPVEPTTSAVRFTYQPTSKVSKSIGTSNGLRPSLEIVTSTTTSTIPTLSPTSTIRLPRSDPLPDLPPYVAPLVAAWLAFGVVAAILLFFIQFPPRCFRSNRAARPPLRTRCAATSRDAYELETLNTTLEPPQAVSTSADSPALDNGELRPGMRKRAMQKNLSVDTSGKYVGLGIAVPGTSIANHAPSPALKTRRSLDSISSRNSYLDQYDGASSHGSASPLNKSWHALDTPKPTAKYSHHATKSVDSQEAARSLRYRLPDDEEAGLLEPTGERVGAFGHRTPWPTPNGSPPSSGPKSSSSRVRLALEKVGDGIEWGTDKLAKLLHDQVKDDYEDGLLLPIRADERERRSSPKLHSN
ncbi:hypothetical protein AC579_786 [Pseudocercospora musae]|uniref:Uncharacterized protein n=1 Tax=Pseudocercospora musae TaxID=113226 RepID=A0A139IHM5_9PEZI|nr:hypothetical protein AC579_786 [Pseudocercospora musae]